MGNVTSSPTSRDGRREGFPGSALLDSAGLLCGSMDDTNDNAHSGNSKSSSSSNSIKANNNSFTGNNNRNNNNNNSNTQGKKSFAGNLLAQADALCISSPTKEEPDEPVETDKMNPTSALFARALVSEVTDNPRTMTPAAMAEREKRLLKAQEAARKNGRNQDGPKPVGAMGKPNVLGSIAHALGGEDPAPPTPTTVPSRTMNQSSSVVPPNSLQENRAQVGITNGSNAKASAGRSKHSITIGLSLSRRHSTVGHPDTVTRQTAFDFNELQDRQYKYVSSTDSSGWMAGGGERGGNHPSIHYSGSGEDSEYQTNPANGLSSSGVSSIISPHANHKVAAPDTVHIPIIQIDAESPAAVDAIISALARGEVFIPHMGILPEALSVNGISPPDLVVRFGCERNDDAPPDEWPNWCLEFMHNQLYEYFHHVGARWMKRPFQITLARKVRWKTVKHMNRYFAHAERVIDAWREKGPQCLDPQLSYIEGGATPEEVARPHGIYLLRNGVPTNYFAPNFDPPYTTKMTRSLLLNVLGKSWDKKRREWTSEPVPRLVTPGMLVASMCGCSDPAQGGFMANEVTNTAVRPDQQKTTVEMARSPTESAFNDSMDRSRSTMSSAHLTPLNTKLDPDPVEQMRASVDDDDDEDDVESDVDDSESEEPKPVETPTSRTSIDRSTLPSEVGSNFEKVSPTSNVTTSNVGNPRFAKYGRSPAPEYARFRSRSPGDRRQRAEDEDVTPSEMGVSVAASNSTVQHMNTASVKIMQREWERKKTRETFKQNGNEGTGHNHQQTKEGALAGVEEEVSPRDDGLTPKTKKKKKKKDKDALEIERTRQIELIAMAQEATSMKAQARFDDPYKGGTVDADEKREAGPKYNMGINSQKSPLGSPEVQRTDSGVSLEYSIDSSLLGDSSTLAGQYFATDGSVTTAQSRRKWRSTLEDDSSLSMQESRGGSFDGVPTDEELFAVGWAKALDPKSGSFYYFTLDRSKIVWDNPLAPESAQSEASASVMSMPQNGAMI